MLLLTLLFVSGSIGQPCSDLLSIDISTGVTYKDGTVVIDSKTFPPKFVYSKNVSGVFKKFGCLCEIATCIRKCCDIDSVISLTTHGCVEDPDNDLMSRKGIDLYSYNYKEASIQISSAAYGMLYDRPCGDDMYMESAPWYLQKDGQLYLEVSHNIPPWMLRGPDKYCIDTFVEEDDYGKKTSHIDALICFAEKQPQTSEYLLSSSCMLISCVFILATLAVYAWLPELRNMHGMVLMVYLTCFFVAFVLLATMQILLIINTISLTACISLTIAIYFALLSAFFWLNVMSFDIWWTFSGKRGHTARLKSTKARFLAYCCYAFGMPLALTVLLVALEFSGLPPRGWMPLLKLGGCFISGNSKIIYLYGPILILCIANLVFYVLTAMKIAQIRKQTSVLKAKDNSTHDQHRSDKQRLILYVKLFMVMGINWVMEVLSAIYPDIEYLWRFTDAYNVLIGVIIFIIFVCKRKIFRLIKKRIKEKVHHNNINDSIGEMKDFKDLQRRRNQFHGQRASQETIRTSLGSDDSNKIQKVL